MSSSPDFNAEQLAAARAKSWHQAGEPLLTLDALRDWITLSGLVLFTPRSLQLPVPAPSLVEAMLGAPNVGPTDGQIQAARGIVSRLVAEGNALPLNLLGIPGDLPDFVVSAQVFSFVYTLRGDKAWKLPPTTVTPLSLRIFEVLTEKGALSAAELATELGRELTESAVQRSLTELWSNLRVIPLLAQGSGPTLWELTSRRFTKAIKAGINAGQPTALSALISLYLAQALLASEDEVETFLSPLSARSRIREVLHALSNSRQLETIVLEGKSLFVVPGTLPEFPAIVKPEPTEEELAAAAAAEVEGEGRIKRFVGSSSERRAIGDFKGKPAASLAARSKRPAPSFGAAKPNAERRPFRRDAAAKPSFSKPWEEDRKPAVEGEEAPKRAYKPRGESAGSTFAKKPYTPREGGAVSSGYVKKPYTPREGGATTGATPGGYAKRPYTPRGEGSGDRGSRPAFGEKRSFGAKPAFRKSASDGSAPTPRFNASSGGERKPFERKPYPPRDGDASRPSRPAFGAKRSFGDRGDKPSFGAKRPYAPKPSFGEGGEKPFTKFRKFDAPKFDRPTGGRPDKPAYGGSDSKPRAPRAPKFGGGDTPFEAKPTWPAKTGRSDGRPGGFGSKPRAPRKESGDFESRPARPAFGAKRSFGDRGDKPSFGDRGARPSSGFGPRGGAPKAGGFSKRPSAPGGKVSFGEKSAPRRGVPGTKPSFPRKPRAEE